jgi:PAS domain S-box-containing protein
MVEKTVSPGLRDGMPICPAVLSSIRGAIVSINDASGRFLGVWGDGGVFRRHGVSPASLVGRGLDAVHAPLEARRQRARIKRVLRTGRSSTQELGATLPKGNFHLRSTIAPLKTGGARATMVVGFIQDVTDWLRVQQAQVQDRSRLQSLVSSVRGAMLHVYDRDGVYQACWGDVNLYRRHGLSPRRMLGQSIRSVLPPRQAEARLRAIRRTWRSGKPVRHDYSTELAGRTFYLETTLAPIRDGRGRVVSVVSFTRDVTRHRQAEKKLAASQSQLRELVNSLRSSERNYRLLVESAGEAISVVDSGGRFLFMNSVAAKRLGGQARQFEGKTMWDLFPREHANRQMRSIRRVLRQRQARDFDTMTVLRGRQHWYATSIAPVRSGRGRPQAALIIARDVSHRHRAQQQLQGAEARLAKARESERRALAAELHDSVGQGLIALQLRLHSAGLSDAAARCRDLVDEVRGICRGLYPPALELGLPAALAQLARSCGGEPVVRLWRPGALAQARFDPSVEIALFRIAQEALANAVRHGGCSKVRISLNRVRGQLLLCIADDGRGITPRSRRGLGMANMRQRAASVGGELKVSSRPGCTRVEVGVPVAGAHEG